MKTEPEYDVEDDPIEAILRQTISSVPSPKPIWVYRDPLPCCNPPKSVSLWRALLVVALMHAVSIGGIIVFHSLRQSETGPTTTPAEESHNAAAPTRLMLP